MEKKLKKDYKFQSNEECQQSLKLLKHKMVTTTILVFPNWRNNFMCMLMPLLLLKA